MTAQEWLALSESEQAVKLAEVLVEKPWKHEWHGDHYGTMCHKCYDYKGDETAPQSCPVSDPIRIHDWDVAMEWRVSVGEDSFYTNLKRVRSIAVGIGTMESKESFLWWILFRAQPIHYLIAAAMAKENK